MSRRQLWSVVRAHKSTCAIILTTHSMQVGYAAICLYIDDTHLMQAGWCPLRACGWLGVMRLQGGLVGGHICVDGWKSHATAGWVSERICVRA